MIPGACVWEKNKSGHILFHRTMGISPTEQLPPYYIVVKNANLIWFIRAFFFLLDTYFLDASAFFGWLSHTDLMRAHIMKITGEKAKKQSCFKLYIPAVGQSLW